MFQPNTYYQHDSDALGRGIRVNNGPVIIPSNDHSNMIDSMRPLQASGNREAKYISRLCFLVRQDLSVDKSVMTFENPPCLCAPTTTFDDLLFPEEFIYE